MREAYCFNSSVCIIQVWLNENCTSLWLDLQCTARVYNTRFKCNLTRISSNIPIKQAIKRLMTSVQIYHVGPGRQSEWLGANAIDTV